MKVIEVIFYCSDNGNEPVREWLLSLDPIDRKTIGEDIMVAEFGWPIGMPVVKNLEKGLWEIRSNISDGKISRVIFTVQDKKMVLLHGFVKKTQKTPKHDLDLARKRKSR